MKDNAAEKITLSPWEKNWLSHSKSSKKTAIRRLKALGLLNEEKDLVILDICCGTGIKLSVLMERGYKSVFGLDLSENLVKKGGIKKIQVGNCLNIGYKSNTFDIVYVIGALHHLQYPEETLACLKEIKRILKPSSYFFICEPFGTIFRRIYLFFLFCCN